MAFWWLMTTLRQPFLFEANVLGKSQKWWINTMGWGHLCWICKGRRRVDQVDLDQPWLLTFQSVEVFVSPATAALCSRRLTPRWRLSLSSFESPCTFTLGKLPWWKGSSPFRQLKKVKSEKYRNKIITSAFKITSALHLFEYSFLNIFKMSSRTLLSTCGSLRAYLNLQSRSVHSASFALGLPQVQSFTSQVGLRKSCEGLECQLASCKTSSYKKYDKLTETL